MSCGRQVYTVGGVYVLWWKASLCRGRRLFDMEVNLVSWEAKNFVQGEANLELNRICGPMGH